MQNTKYIHIHADRSLVLSAERAPCDERRMIHQSAAQIRLGDEEEHAPSVSRALPPVGWQSTLAHEPQRTTVCACEKTVVMAKQPMWGDRIQSVSRSRHTYTRKGHAPGHLTSMKKELGDCTRRLSLCCLCSYSFEGLRRSTARVCKYADQQLGRTSWGIALTMVVLLRCRWGRLLAFF